MTDIIYLFDPLCGWCYGASKGLDALAADTQNHIRLQPTGLFSRTGRIMDAEMAAFAWKNDKKIAALTGAVFSETYRRQVLENQGGAFDSYIIVQALTAVAQTAPEREIEALKAFQTARYIDGKNIAAEADAAAVLESVGLSQTALLLGSAELTDLTNRRIAEGRKIARQLGISGVPALLFETGQGWQQQDSRILFQAP